MHMNNQIGNITTIATLISGTIIAYIGTDIITQDQLTGIIAAIITLAWLLINSKYPNTLKILGNQTEPENPVEPQILNDEYDC